MKYQSLVDDGSGLDPEIMKGVAWMASQLANALRFHSPDSKINLKNWQEHRPPPDKMIPLILAVALDHPSEFAEWVENLARYAVSEGIDPCDLALSRVKRQRNYWPMRIT